MLDFSDLLVFTKVVEVESLTRAGELLGMPKSTVSRRISRLEAHLGSQLLLRSSRSVTVTPDGALFFEYCLRSLGVLRDGERALQSQQRRPQGLVRLALPPALGQILAPSLLAEFLELYPDLRVITALSDDPASLLREGFDLAVCVGPLADSGLFAVRLGTSESGAFGAPTYFERKGVPQSHAELTRFDLLAAGLVDRNYRWLLSDGRHEVAVSFSPRLVCNDLVLLREAVLAGLGIANLPAFLCKHDLAEGRLVETLPGWKTEDVTFHAVFTDPKTLPTRVRALIDFMVERLRRRLSWEIG
ncbi:MAG: LysR family transcriptional regulator [Caulobacter sp.]|jgi:DNA-binding transcriptional LysR family regulator|nr:LysR family transcriptional regulator [Caulobacter sp.]